MHTSFNFCWISFFISSRAFWSSSNWLSGWVWLWVWLCDWRFLSSSLGLFRRFSILKNFSFQVSDRNIIWTYIGARDRNILSNQLAIMPDFDKLYPLNIYFRWTTVWTYIWWVTLQVGRIPIAIWIDLIVCFRFSIFDCMKRGLFMHANCLEPIMI